LLMCVEWPAVAGFRRDRPRTAQETKLKAAV
jgi:hypothetical protein